MERALRQTLTLGRFDNVSPAHSRRMAAVKSRGNKTTEQRLRSAIVRAGIIGWKVNPAGMIGNPDFYFPREKLAIFVDGCFWHGCPDCGHVPSVNNAYWSAKLIRNKQRDAQKASELRKVGIDVLRFWEHDVQGDIKRCVTVIHRAIRNQPQGFTEFI